MFDQLLPLEGLNPENLMYASSSLSSITYSSKEDSARKPEIPLFPLADAKSAGVLPNGNSAEGSVNAPGDAPRETRVATVSSL
nr:hypothetical protein Iba_chr04cCG0500 [Ipomoea batatas]